MGNKRRSGVKKSSTSKVKKFSGSKVSKSSDSAMVGGDVMSCTDHLYADATFFSQALTLITSSGIAVGAYNLLKAWIDAKNGQKLKLKVGEIEVEATKMREEDVLRLLRLLQQEADEKKIRDLLLENPNALVSQPNNKIRDKIREKIKNTFRP